MALKVGALFATLELNDKGFSKSLNSAQSVFRKAANNFKSLDLSGLGTSLSKYANQLSKTVDLQKKFAGELSKTVSLPAAAGLGYAAKEAIEFEDAFAGVEKTVDASTEELSALRSEFIRLSEDIPVSKEALAGIGEQAGQLGIAADVIDEFTETIANLNATTNLSDDAASDLAQFANITGMKQSGENFERLGSTIVDLGNHAATSEAKIVSMAMRLAGAGTNAGMSQSDILGIATALSSLGIEAEMGGSAFSRLINDILIAVETGSDELEGFAEVAGMSAQEFSRAFREDAAGVLSDFIVGLGNGSKSAIQIMDDLGITELRLTDALSRSANASGLFSESLKRASAAWKENNALSIEASKRYQTTASRLKMLKNQADNAAMSFGDAMLPMLEDAMAGASGLIERFAGLDESTRKNIVTFGMLAAAAGPAVKLLSAANRVIGTVAGGLGKLAAAAAAAGGGFAGLGSAILKGLGAALGPAGLVLTAGVGIAVAWKLLKTEEYEPELAGKVSEILDGIEIDEELIANVTADFKLSEETQANVDAFAESASGVYSEIGKALTDGMPDTSAIVDGLEKNVNGLFSEVRANIEEWYSAEMDKLDLNTGEGIAKAEELTRLRDEYITQTEKTEAATGSFINTWAGASTQLVEQHVGELDALLGKITSLNEEIKVREELARSAQRYSFDVVSMGQTTSSETVSEALNYAYLNWSLDFDAIERHAEEQFDLANKAFSTGGEAWTDFLSSSGLLEQLGGSAVYADWEALFTANQSAEIAAASDAYRNSIRAVFDGIFKANGDVGQQFKQQLSAYMSGRQAVDGAGSVLDMIDMTSLAKMTPDQKSKLQAAVGNMLQNYAAVIGEEFSGSAVLQSALETGDTMTVSSIFNGLVAELETRLEGLEDQLVSTLSGEELSGVGEALKLAVESGMLEGLQGVDMENVNSQLDTLFAALSGSEAAANAAQAIGSDISAGIGQGASAYSYDGDAASTIENLEGSLRSAAQSHSPARAFEPVGNDISAGIGQGMKAFDFSGIASGIVSGLAAGIRAGRLAVTSAAREIALAAANAAKSALKIHSPSRVTMGFGQYFGEGFAQGILGSAKMVTGAASDLARSAANATAIRNPGARAAQTVFSGSSTAQTAIDYDRLADAMSQRPMTLVQDGRVVARVQARNTAQAHNSYERAYALAYGK